VWVHSISICILTLTWHNYNHWVAANKGLIYLFIYLFIFGSTGAWIQNLTLARQVSYCLSHSQRPYFMLFCAWNARPQTFMWLPPPCPSGLSSDIVKSPPTHPTNISLPGAPPRLPTSVLMPPVTLHLGMWLPVVYWLGCRSPPSTEWWAPSRQSWKERISAQGRSSYCVCKSCSWPFKYLSLCHNQWNVFLLLFLMFWLLLP
jgi:hypothetical protein